MMPYPHTLEALRLENGGPLPDGATLSDLVFELIKNHGSVTFVDLTRYLGKHARGEHTMQLLDYPNVVLWAGLSAGVIDSLIRLLEEKRIIMVRVQTRTYLLNGSVLGLPPVKRLTKRGFKTPRWLPVCFRVAGTGVKAGVINA